ncbi:methyltransferase [Streptomyces sp. NPDC048172]|uniref:methyltransferase n=1 Tax=Streptomyces sp. NPDC048172 TaxID=3365505 RepID=UPI00371B4BBC
MNEEDRGAEDRGRVFQLLFGAMAARTVGTAVELGIVDLIGEGEGERGADALAADLGAPPGTTLRLLRALAALGMLTETREGVFAVTDTGAVLSERHPRSMASLVRIFDESLLLRAWDRLGESVRTGRPAFDAVHGTDFFSYLKDDDALSARFNAAMSQSSRATADVLPAHYDFGRFSTVVDVGGGDATLLAAILRAHPGPRGVVYDTAEGLAQAWATLEAAGVAERASAVAGDFFASVPEGGDLYLLKSVLHDWDDDRCVTILRHVRAVLPPHGRLLIVEPVLPTLVDPDATGGVPYLSDLNMLVNMGGRERTQEDFAALCEASGFGPPSYGQLPPPLIFSTIETTPH